MSTINAGERRIGPGEPCFIIAEAGVNHNGQRDLAKKLVDAADSAGADAVKFQTFRAERLVLADAPKAEYQVRTSGGEESQYEMLKRLELSEDDHRTLLEYCRQKGIVFLSTPFDEVSAEFLDELGVPLMKVGSGDLTNLPLLVHIAGTGRPMIISTGMATLEEVRTAVKAVRQVGNDQIVLLQCVTNYPADPADVNLRAMTTMREQFGVVVGYSDHTLGIEVSIAAVALGACVIEKHFTVNRALPGPDQRASLEPQELAALVSGIRKLEAALGDGVKRPADSEAEMITVARRSLTAAVDIPAGTMLTRAMIAVRRPATGLAPALLEQTIGRRATEDIRAGTSLQEEMLAAEGGLEGS